MKRKIFLVVCLVGLLGWFGVKAGQAQDRGSLMQDSGFKKWNVDTPQEKAFFDKHPQDKFITYRRGDKVVHVHKDSKTGVVLAGDDTALKSYMKKAKEKLMTPKDRSDAAKENDPIFWDMWASEHGLG